MSNDRQFLIDNFLGELYCIVKIYVLSKGLNYEDDKLIDFCFLILLGDLFECES